MENIIISDEEDTKKVSEMENEIISMEKRRFFIENEIEQIKNNIKAVYIKYHKMLIDADFYKNYILYSGGSNKTLDEKFYINQYNLPYSDHGEGDYIKIRFKISGNSLNVLYSCSYDQNKDSSLIRIPLALFKDDNSDLKYFLDSNNKEAKETHERLIVEAKQKKINELKSEIKTLSKT